MTVLHRQTTGGDPQRLRKSMIAVAMAVVGVGAAFGLSQVMGSDSASLVEPGHPARVEAGVAYGAALEKAAEIRAREAAGAAYGAALESARQTSVGSEAMATNARNLDGELEAIRGGKLSVGSAAIAANASSLDGELEAIRGGTPFGDESKHTPNQNIK